MRRLWISCLFSLATLCPIPTAFAADGLATLKVMSISSLLSINQNQRVTLLMQSGREITGTVSGAGGATVHLRALQGMEFYDAVINIDNIEAVIARVRNE